MSYENSAIHCNYSQGYFGLKRIIQNILFGERKWFVLRHTLLWTFLYADELLYTFIDPEGVQDLDILLASVLLDFLMVYFNLYYLIPKFIRQEKYLTYLSLSSLTVIVNVVIMNFYNSYYFEMEMALDDYVSWFITNATLLATAVAIKIGKYAYVQKRMAEHLKLEQSKLELNYLKKQINPHFLFNVLNTIHIQSMADPKSVSQTVMQLSDLLRYQIYDAGQNERITLQKEIEFLKNYSNLEKLRRKNLALTWREQNALPKVRITPFLFLPLIENAFKHSKLLNEQNAIIDILWAYDNKQLTLEVRNTIGNANDGKSGGFGIENLKRRLELLYPGKYSLSLKEEMSLFVSKLELKIDEGNNY